MNTLDQILVVDVNVIIHLEKVGLLDKLIEDSKIRIVDLVLYQEYEFKRNLISDKVHKIKKLTLDDKQILEANSLNKVNPRNSFFDYCSYIVARDNNYALLTGDWKLNKYINGDISVYGAIWYVQKLRYKGIISKEKLLSVYETWLGDSTIFIDDAILNSLIINLESMND